MDPVIVVLFFAFVTFLLGAIGKGAIFYLLSFICFSFVGAASFAYDYQYISYLAGFMALASVAIALIDIFYEM